MEVKIKFEKYMYMSTITCLSRPLKIKVVPGEYTLQEHKLGGHIFAKDNYVPKNQHIRKVLNLRDGDPGLSGTYHDGDSTDPVLLDYLNTYFKPYFTDDIIMNLKGCDDDDDDDYDDEYYDDTDSNDSDYEGDNYDDFGNYDSDDFNNRNLENDDLNYIIVNDYYADSDHGDINDEGYNYRTFSTIKKYGKICSIPSYHNIPIMFYCKIKPPYMNLRFYKWCKFEKSGIIVWAIKHKMEGIIGVAVQQPRFYDMMGDQMGLVVYSQNEHDALGFTNYSLDLDKTVNFDEEVFQPRHKSKLQYVCDDQ